jgi:hypothetical protein
VLRISSETSLGAHSIITSVYSSDDILPSLAVSKKALHTS